MAERSTQQENQRLKEMTEVAHPPDLVGQGPAMKKVFDAIETVGPTDATVLITGETARARNWWRGPSTLPARGDITHWW